MQILEQEGLPKKKEEGGCVLITDYPRMYYDHIYLRGGRATFDYEPDYLTFRSNQERDEYLDKITKAITDELFTSNGELKIGEMCEVKISDRCEWATRKLLAILPEEQSYRYICNHSSLVDAFTMCKYARPLAKRTEPKVEENGEVITYTWEEK